MNLYLKKKIKNFLFDFIKKNNNNRNSFYSYGIAYI